MWSRTRRTSRSPLYRVATNMLICDCPVGPLQALDRPHRDPAGQRLAVILLDERQCQVQRTRDTAGRRDVPVPDVDRVGVDLHLG